MSMKNHETPTPVHKITSRYSDTLVNPIEEHKTVEDLYHYMKSKHAYKPVLNFIESCTSLDQVYARADIYFWYSAILAHPSYLLHTPTLIQKEFDKNHWRSLVVKHVELIGLVPQEAKARWDIYDYTWLVRAHPTLRSSVPTNIVKNLEQ